MAGIFLRQYLHMNEQVLVSSQNGGDNIPFRDTPWFQNQVEKSESTYGKSSKEVRQNIRVQYRNSGHYLKEYTTQIKNGRGEDVALVANVRGLEPSFVVTRLIGYCGAPPVPPIATGPGQMAITCALDVRFNPFPRLCGQQANPN